MDIYDSRAARAMLIGRDEKPFDDPDYIFELKLDGDRCLAYLGPEGSDFINKRGRNLNLQIPELMDAHKLVRQRCILDGEMVVGTGQKHEFEYIRSRLGSSDPKRIKRLSAQLPVTFVAYDILYLDEQQVTSVSLLERKSLLSWNVSESERLALTRFIPERGLEFYRLVEQQNLEGLVAKRADSEYRMGNRSDDWVKFKNWADDDFVIVGYWPSDKANVVSLVLGQYRLHDDAPPELVYKSYVMLGRNNWDFPQVEATPRRSEPTVFWGPKPEKHHKTIWLEPLLVCKVEFICRTSTGGLRQPIFKGLRDDKAPEECVEPETSVLSCSV